MFRGVLLWLVISSLLVPTGVCPCQFLAMARGAQADDEAEHHAPKTPCCCAEKSRCRQAILRPADPDVKPIPVAMVATPDECPVVADHDRQRPENLHFPSRGSPVYLMVRALLI
jgi:hypothetical protein